MIQNIFPLPGATYTGVAKAPTGSHLAFAMRRLQRRWLRLSRALTALTGSHLASPEAAGEAAGFFMVVGVLGVVAELAKNHDIVQSLIQQSSVSDDAAKLQAVQTI